MVQTRITRGTVGITAFLFGLSQSAFAQVIVGDTNAIDALSKQFRRHSNEQRRLSDEWILKNLLDQSTKQLSERIVESSVFDNHCPCTDPSWCHRSLENEKKRKGGNDDDGIVYGFAGSNKNVSLYNWTHIDVVAWASDEIMCKAHEHGARVVLAAPSFTFFDDNITEWVHKTKILVQSRHFDGVVFDYEKPMTKEQANFYTSLINATRNFFQQHNLQVVTCVAWSPDGIDDRNYPYKALADASDYLYVMDYDTRSQIFDACVASANAPMAGMIQGIQRYLLLGIEASKLILGVPWYGYRYPCLHWTSMDARFCEIPQVPFRGVNCSDAAGKEVGYGKILKRYDYYRKKHQASAMNRDEYMDAMYFNSVEATNTTTTTKYGSSSSSSDTTVYQYWFDDAISLTHKYSWAKKMNLGGIGPYTFEYLDPVNFPNESQDIWSAFDVFFSSENSIHENNDVEVIGV